MLRSILPFRQLHKIVKPFHERRKIDNHCKRLEDATERSDGNRGRSPRKIVTNTMRLEDATPEDKLGTKAYCFQIVTQDS